MSELDKLRQRLLDATANGQRLIVHRMYRGGKNTAIAQALGISVDELRKRQDEARAKMEERSERG